MGAWGFGGSRIWVTWDWGFKYLGLGVSGAPGPWSSGLFKVVGDRPQTELS